MNVGLVIVVAGVGLAIYEGLQKVAQALDRVANAITTHGHKP